MGRKNSRDKGGRGERAAAKEFRDWWGTDFARTPSSGGFATAKFRDDWNAAGDLVTPDNTFPFCVECKWVEDWTMEQLLSWIAGLAERKATRIMEGRAHDRSIPLRDDPRYLRTSVTAARGGEGSGDTLIVVYSDLMNQGEGVFDIHR